MPQATDCSTDPHRSSYPAAGGALTIPQRMDSEREREKKKTRDLSRRRAAQAHTHAHGAPTHTKEMYVYRWYTRSILFFFQTNDHFFLIIKSKEDIALFNCTNFGNFFVTNVEKKKEERVDCRLRYSTLTFWYTHRAEETLSRWARKRACASLHRRRGAMLMTPPSSSFSSPPQKFDQETFKTTTGSGNYKRIILKGRHNYST